MTDQPQNSFEKTHLIKEKGLTLPEVLITVGIVGILSAISLPNFVNEVQESRQREAASAITQIQSSIAAYSDEFGELPKNWSDLNKVNAIMTDKGPTQSLDFNEIQLADRFYKASISNTDNKFIIHATRSDEPNLDILACIDLSNGASDIKFGSKKSGAVSPNC